MSYDGFDSPFGFVGMHGTGGAGPSNGGYASSVNQNPDFEDNWQEQNSLTNPVKELNSMQLELRTVSREYDDLCSLESQCKREMKALPGKQEERKLLREKWLKKEKKKKEKQAEEEIKEVRKKIEEQEKKMRYGNHVSAENVDKARQYVREQSALVFAEILMLRDRIPTQPSPSETAPVVDTPLAPNSDEFLLSSDDFVVDHEEVFMVDDEDMDIGTDESMDEGIDQDRSGSEVSSICESCADESDDDMIVEEIIGDSENQPNLVEMNVEDSDDTTNQEDEQPVGDQEIELNDQEPVPLTIEQILAEVGDSKFGDAIRNWQQHEEWQNFAIDGVDLNLHLFNPFGSRIDSQPVRKPASGRDLFLFQIKASNKRARKLTEKARGPMWESMGEERQNEWKRHRENIVEMQKEQRALGLIKALQSNEYKEAMEE